MVNPVGISRNIMSNAEVEQQVQPKSRFIFHYKFGGRALNLYDETTKEPMSS